MRALCCGLAMWLLAPSPQAQAGSGKNLGFEVPPGFEVTLFADDALATDIFALTIDAKGRVVVAGKGYVKILHDTDGDGKADKTTLFADMPKSGAHGLCFDGNDLICTGDQGVRRLYDLDGDGVCDKISAPYFPTKNDGEHAANGIVRGPDGWFYMITGNDAGITKEHAQGPGSAIKTPNAGVLLRFSPDGKTTEVLAHGFRNPYDLAFNHLGHVFTVDADGERVHQMPYYAPNRLFDIQQGGHHGWILPGWVGSWSRPPYWPDVVERLFEVGRGSPTGVHVYRHRKFPPRYRHGVFSLCWTFGRVYFFPLTRDRSTYESKMEIFMRTTGDVGFAPTDMAVGPEGDLFVSIGGRGTRGGVFRVRYQGTDKSPRSATGADSSPPLHKGGPESLEAILSADEPLSSWSRARWLPAAKKLSKKDFSWALLGWDKRNLTQEQRLRAVEILTELFGGVAVGDAYQISAKEEELVARLIWSLSRTRALQPTAPTDRALDERLQYVVKMTASASPIIARAAWEALAAWPLVQDARIAAPDWQMGLHRADRRVRELAYTVIERWQSLSGQPAVFSKTPSARETLALLRYDTIRGKRFILEPPLLPKGALAVFAKDKDPHVRLEAVRLLQMHQEDVEIFEGPTKAFFGYTRPDPLRKLNAELKAKVPELDAKWKAILLRSWTAQEREALVAGFPSEHRPLDMEIARLLGMLGEETPGFLDKLATRWSGKTAPEDDIHYLLVLARLPGKRSATVTRQTAFALNGIHVKLAVRGAKPTDQVPGILEAVLDKLLEHDDALAQAIVDDPAFGMPGHALYANRLPVAQKQAAARTLVARLDKLDEEEARLQWGPELVKLVATLPDDEALPVLRKRASDPRLADGIALVLAQKGRPEDRDRLIAALGSTQPGVVAAAANALATMKSVTGPTPLDMGKAIRSLRRLDMPKADAPALTALRELIARWTKQKEEKTTAAWVDWYTKSYPQEAASLPGLVSADFATWKKRLDKIAWEDADPKRGELIYQKKNCYRCHADARRLGPDLVGVGQRFARDDLFTAILDPNKDISPAYRSTTITTNAGKIYTGMVIYDSPALYLLQTTPDTTVRIAAEELQSVHQSNISFMPTGLLDDLRDQDLADLYAYLKNLRKGK